MNAQWATPSMPQAVAEIFEFICPQMCDLHERWEDFRALCVPKSEKPEDVESKDNDIRLLNSVASDFFASCQDSLLHDVIISLCRLTDKEEHGRNRNVSLHRLVGLLANNGETELTAMLEPKLLRSLTPARPCGNTETNGSPILICTWPRGAILGPVTIQAIDAVFGGIRGNVEPRFDSLRQHLLFLPPRRPGGSADGLLYCLWKLLPEGRWPPRSLLP